LSLKGAFWRLEGGLAGLSLVLMAILPLAEAGLRGIFGIGIPGSLPFVQHLTLWVTFLGAALASREDKLLTLATGEFLPEGRWREAAKIGANTIAAAITALLARAAWDLVVIERQAGTEVAAGFPVWVAQVVMPIGFALIALRLVKNSAHRWVARIPALIGLLLGLLLGQFPLWLEGAAVLPLVGIVLVATLLGGPIFAALGGLAVLLFLAEGVPAAAVPVETYRLVVSPTLPAIPLFTLSGFMLAQGGASERLLRVFRALFGWVPGGTAIVAAMSCAFFTVLTGGSGVTILALGGLLFQALRSDGYRERFSLGLLTASGSLGLLFPPALPLMLYGIVAQIAIPDLFLGGLVPGLLLLLLVAAWGVREGAPDLRPGSTHVCHADGTGGRQRSAAFKEVHAPGGPGGLHRVRVMQFHVPRHEEGRGDTADGAAGDAGRRTFGDGCECDCHSHRTNKNPPA